MNWLNLRVTTLRMPEYVGSEPAHRAAWLNVLCYCCEQENAGRIVGAKAWKCRQWQQTCGVTLDEVNGAAELLNWDGQDLVIWEYPADKEGEVKRMRSQAGNAAAKRWKAKSETPQMPDGMPDGIQAGNAEGKDKGKERKEEATAATGASPDDPHIPTPDEVVTAGTGAGVPPDYCKHFHDKTTEKRVWLNGYGRLVDWRRQLVRFWRSDQATWRGPDKKKSAKLNL